MRPRFLAACLAMLLCEPAAALPPPGVELVRIVSQPMRASDLLGLEVRTRDGEPAGTIGDLALDFERNRVDHALVSTARGLIAVGLLDLRLSLERTYAMLPRQRVADPRGKDTGPSARALLGRPVYARDGRQIGELDDMLVDAHAGSVPFVLLRMEDNLLHPLPLDALHARNDRLVLRIDARELQGGRSFSAAELNERLGDNAFLRANADYADRLTVGR
jgi:sporulation protein YlmC with PRC-barrel domain